MVCNTINCDQFIRKTQRFHSQLLLRYIFLLNLHLMGNLIFQNKFKKCVNMPLNNQAYYSPSWLNACWTELKIKWSNLQYSCIFFTTVVCHIQVASYGMKPTVSGTIIEGRTPFHRKIQSIVVYSDRGHCLTNCFKGCH